MLPRSITASALRVGSTSHPMLARGIATAVPLLRQQERLPRGHVRPTRRPIRHTPLPDTDERPGPSYQSTTTTTATDGPQAFHAYEPYDPLVIPPVHHSGRVDIPPDPSGVLGDSHAAREILGHESLVIVRQLEMLNVFMGFEQANRYAIHSPDGQLVGFLAEQEQGILSTISRQALRTHRPFRSVVMDRYGKPVLWIRRPFAFINSRIFVHSSEDPDSRLVGEAQQQWHPWRRRYNLFQSRESDTFRQFAKVDSGFLAWDFWLKGKDDHLLASINRNFRGIGRELFTDTGQYVIRFDAAGTELDLAPGSNINVQGQTLVLPRSSDSGLTLDQRAMTLATAVSIDFDYFSRHSGSGGLGFPFFFWGGGDGSAEAQAGGRPSDVQPLDGGAGAAAAGAAAGAASGGADMTEDELIYGRQPAQPGNPTNNGPVPPPAQEEGTGGWEQFPEGLEGYDEESGWEQDEVMQDPWGNQGGDGGWFGGGSGGGGGGGDWGDWGQ
ncbi:hypothetical protein I307_01265 [Cryptococcus deuterogattii 99/473]|uniref:Phospholipid scramblase n=1 Tax=Cryptococcus deuterogattii Ram5 TaxID=1296110 RepID=A0A0D0TU36_9TREE|nr:hypothetical protein I313_04409 [Cryptococcus deuterogattii Ram5]KIY59018.1 hypothetical protein I307_01265 [Cryptococcus deuterogattii 99/473]